MMKRLGTVLLGAAFILSFPYSSLAAAEYGSGTWDYMGSDVFTSQSKNFPSGGGDFKICLSNDSKEGYYKLWEEDPYAVDKQVPDDYVDGYDPYFPYDFNDSGPSGYKCLIYHSIGGWVDGDNNQAEFYVTKSTGGNSTVRAYD
jgi:hypothetical protein